MDHLTRSVGFLAVAVTAAFATPAGAVTWDAGNKTTTNAQTTSACAGSVACQFTVNASGGSAGTAKFRAYSNSAMDNTGNNPGPVGSASGGTGWIAAQNFFYSGSGFGIRNSSEPEGTSSPEHATDNRNVVDIMVIELPDPGAGFTWDVTSFMSGWAREGFGGTNDPHSADYELFIGGQNLGANFNFAGVCFDAGSHSQGSCGAGDTALSTLGGGFKNITSAIQNFGNGPGMDVPEGTSASVTTNNTGRYLVLTGQLGGAADAFKLKQINALKTNHTPLPGTLALLGLGLLGLVSVRRRSVA